MPTDDRPIRVLLVEDNPEHADLFSRLLAGAEFPKFTVTCVPTLADGLSELAAAEHDVVLLDLLLPDGKGRDVFLRVAEAAPELPVVVLSGIGDVTGAIEMVQEGAQDYLVKGHVDSHLLLRSLRYAIERKRHEVAAQRQNEALEQRVTARTAELLQANRQLLREVAERRDVEEQLVKSNRQLSVALAELRAMQRTRPAPEPPAAAMREVEEAFRSVQQHSELLLHAPALTANHARATEHLRHILAAIETGRKAVRLAREKASPVAPSPAAGEGRAGGKMDTVELDKLAADIIATAKAKAGDTGGKTKPRITFSAEIGKGTDLFGDTGRLREMLSHLVRNAANAIPKRGTVTVTAAKQGSEVHITVQDDGLGLTEAARRRLLQPGVLAGGKERDPSGYEIIHEAVARHRGRLDIESRKGIGTTVRLTFPTARAARALARRRRVLAVDDDPMVREVIGTYLGEDGYTVELAANGREALEKFSAGEFDIVVTDYAMPEMNGDALAVEIHNRKPGLPVLLLTGFADQFAKSGATPEGIACVMSKPFTMAGLQSAVAKYLGT